MSSCRVSRRQFLGAAAAAGVVTTLGACGGGSSTARTAARPLATPGTRPFPRLPPGT
ncbi:MAG: twin-arginine translocation signal domain-containing protein, partial [Actinobacteria bacterium]